MFDKPVDLNKTYGVKPRQKRARPEPAPKLTPHPFDEAKDHTGRKSEPLPASIEASVQAAKKPDPSVEALFEDESFEPQWMKDRREAERQALEEGVTLGVRKSWDKAAELSRQRISAKYPSKKRS